MSDYHILEMGNDKKSIRVVFHIPVPGVGNNKAGIQWRVAVVKHLGGSANIVSILSDIEQAEDTQLKAGEIIERDASVRFSSINLTDAERKQEVEDRFDSVKTSLISELQIELSWIGFVGNVGG